MDEKGPSDKEKTEIPASELDDESLIDRLFPDEVIKWVKETFGRDEKDEEE
jgi:hypothetical protein